MPSITPQLSAALAVAALVAVAVVIVALSAVAAVAVPRAKRYVRALFLAGWVAGLAAAGVGQIVAARPTPPGAAP